ncbi:hypothetical protein [Evtepia sp.]|uniref:hypothetical protein n=1 Tax=Evtepia sp. TaxID=2773933 RepID=UPI002A800340|nr:hypothetical protein [Evtepia sp.]MDY4430195.1 hypothetical protein [Evtepia sp.]
MDAEHMETLTEEFKACRKVLLALGDENRQHLLLEMMQMLEHASAILEQQSKEREEAR